MEFTIRFYSQRGAVAVRRVGGYNSVDRARRVTNVADLPAAVIEDQSDISLAEITLTRTEAQARSTQAFKRTNHVEVWITKGDGLRNFVDLKGQTEKDDQGVITRFWWALDPKATQLWQAWKDAGEPTQWDIQPAGTAE